MTCATAMETNSPLDDLVERTLRHRSVRASWRFDDLPVTCAHSFAGTTPALMANGTRTPISEVTVGDQVLATNPETGETGAREVLATLPHTDRLLTLKTSSGDVVTTEDHRYWNASDEEWQESQDLDEGDRLLSADGDIVTVVALDWTTLHTADAYDLTIDDLHTFYVAAGNDEILVHNDCITTLADFMKTSPDDLVVLGRQADTSVAAGWPGHQVLDLASWSPPKNRQFIQAVISRKQTVYVGSPLSVGNLKGTVFGDEINQLTAAGYRFSADRLYLLPPD